MSATLIPLSEQACVALLAANDVGRIAVVHDGFPVALPVNYRLISLDGTPVLAIRTRVGNTIDHVGEPVGFEIDGIDPGHDGGWSVLVRGHLRAVSPSIEVDSFPLITAQRDAWRLLLPVAISGRRVRADAVRWSFHPAGYL